MTKLLQHTQVPPNPHSNTLTILFCVWSKSTNANEPSELSHRSWAPSVHPWTAECRPDVQPWWRRLQIWVWWAGSRQSRPVWCPPRWSGPRQCWDSSAPFSSSPPEASLDTIGTFNNSKTGTLLNTRARLSMQTSTFYLRSEIKVKKK